jgi:hypothetical protein
MRLLTKLVSWLDRRFPEKVIITLALYDALYERQGQIHAEISTIRSLVEQHEMGLAKTLERLSVVESNAVHKGAVQDLVIAVKAMKEDYATFKANVLGGNKASTDADINALFNGSPL